MMQTTKNTLINQLEALGLKAGDLVMVHASMRRVGPVIGGADAVLDAIIEVIGAKGTLLMVFGADESEPFDANTTPVEDDIGILAEVFRKRPGTQVNDHPAARYGSIGQHAATLLMHNPLHNYHGPGSILEQFTALGGLVLRLGADIDTVTVTHWAEYIAEVPEKQRVRRRYIRADTGELWIESLDDTNGITTWAGGDYFSQILLDFLAQDKAGTGPVGNCRAELFHAKEYVPFAVKWMESNLKVR